MAAHTGGHMDDLHGHEPATKACMRICGFTDFAAPEANAGPGYYK